MANHKSAIKRHKQSLKARSRNRALKTRIRNAVKNVQQAIQGQDKDKASEALRDAASVLDKAAGKRVIHWRTAGRKISRLTLSVNKIGG